MIGKRISWRGVNRVLSGIVIRQTPLGYAVRLDNGKIVIVHPDSIITTE